MPSPHSFTQSEIDYDNMGVVKGLLSFIVPTIYRKKSETPERLVTPVYSFSDLLRDIHQNVTTPFEVIVVCNENNNKELISFVNESPHITRYCQNSENVGVPRAWNQGVQLAKGEFLCFVNDDVEIGYEAVESIVRYLTNNREVGLVSSSGAKWYRKDPGAKVGEKYIEDADVIGGWFFITTREVFEKVGGFDIAYTPALMEEIDYSFAVRAAGYACRVLPGLNIVHHHVSGASSTNKPITALGFSFKRDELTNRNRIYFENKWNQFWERKNDQ
jgi:GT2 family glycosyltransferase